MLKTGKSKETSTCFFIFVYVYNVCIYKQCKRWALAYFFMSAIVTRQLRSGTQSTTSSPQLFFLSATENPHLGNRNFFSSRKYLKEQFLSKMQICFSAIDCGRANQEKVQNFASTALKSKTPVLKPGLPQAKMRFFTTRLTKNDKHITSLDHPKSCRIHTCLILLEATLEICLQCLNIVHTYLSTPVMIPLYLQVPKSE